MKSRGFQQSAGTHGRHPVAGGQWRPRDLLEAQASCRRSARVCDQSNTTENKPMRQIRLRFRFGFGGPSMRRWSSRGMGGLLLFAAGRGGGGSLIPV